MIEPNVAVFHAFREQLQSAENAFDPEPIIRLMADDMVLMVPNEPVQEGKPACAAFVRRILAEQQEWFDRVISYVSEEVAIRRGVAFDRGSFSFTVVVKHNGRRSEPTGKDFCVCARSRRRVEAGPRDSEPRRRTGGFLLIRCLARTPKY